MRCATCVSEGRESRVHNRGMRRTLLAGGGEFFDEKGVRHYHDPNTTTTRYECSNGHTWEENTRAQCPGCKEQAAERPRED